MKSSLCAAVASFLLVLAVVPQATAISMPPVAGGNQARVSDVAPQATSTSISVSPSSGTSATVFHVSATVSPAPDSGEVRFTGWSAATGGTIEWDHTFEIHSDGSAAVPGGLSMDPGTYWWQADYLGDDTFLASTSATRKSIAVSGLATALVSESLTWGQDDIDFGGQGGAVNGIDGGSNEGEIDLVVDGDVYASCKQWDNQPASCSVVNNVPTGFHDAAIRFRPENVRYGTATGPSQTVYSGAGFPANGIAIESGRASINRTDVTINILSSVHDGSTAVRISNTNDVGGDGLLTDGTTFAYATSIPWDLVAGADGPRTIWAQFEDSDGNWGTPETATIVLDTTPPTGSFLINNGDATVGDPWTNSIDDQTLSGTVTDPGSPGTLINMAFSNDGQRWRYTPFVNGDGSFSTDWDITDNTYGGRASDNGFYPGIKTVYGKFQDAAGNWSAVVTDTIDYIDLDSVADLYIDGQTEHDNSSPTFKSSPDVTVSVTVHILPPADNALVKVKFFGNNENRPCATENWPDGATTVTISWSLVSTACGYTAKDGAKDISADIVTKKGGLSVGGIVVLDRVVPAADGPLPAFSLDYTVNEVAGNGSSTLANDATGSTTSATTTIAWKATDKSPIVGYGLQSKAGTAWTGVTLSDPSASSTNESLDTGSTSQYRVDATDAAGNTGSWKKGPAYSMSVVDETSVSIKYVGGWRTSTTSDALGGTLRLTTQKGAYATYTFTGRAIAWVAPRSAPYGDSIAVYVDGKLIKMVALSATTYEPRRVVFSMAWKADGKHTIKLVKKFANSSALPVDAFLLLS